jgi:hypothetical protein
VFDYKIYRIVQEFALLTGEHIGRLAGSFVPIREKEHIHEGYQSVMLQDPETCSDHFHVNLGL